MQITVTYGPNCQEVEVPEDATPQSVMADNFIARLVGYYANERSVALVNGCRAEWNKPLVAGDQLEIVKRAGNKAFKVELEIIMPAGNKG
jgi:hypothetical protein